MSDDVAKLLKVFLGMITKCISIVLFHCHTDVPYGMEKVEMI